MGEDAKSKAEQATKREEALKKKEEEEKEKAKEEAHEKKIEADHQAELAGESSPGPTGGCSNCIYGKCENSKCICQSGWKGEACDAEVENVGQYATTTPAVSVPTTAPTSAPITAPTTGPSGSGSSDARGAGSSDASGAGSSGASGAGSSGASGAGGTATLAPVIQAPGTVRACTPQTCENGDCINNDNECKFTQVTKEQNAMKLFVPGICVTGTNTHRKANVCTVQRVMKGIVYVSLAGMVLNVKIL